MKKFQEPFHQTNRRIPRPACIINTAQHTRARIILWLIKASTPGGGARAAGGMHWVVVRENIKCTKVIAIGPQHTPIACAPPAPACILMRAAPFAECPHVMFVWVSECRARGAHLWLRASSASAAALYQWEASGINLLLSKGGKSMIDCCLYFCW